MEWRRNVGGIRDYANGIEKVEVPGLLGYIRGGKPEAKVAGERSIVHFTEHGSMAGLVEAVEHNAIEVREVLDLKCESIAEFLLRMKLTTAC